MSLALQDKDHKPRINKHCGFKTTFTVSVGFN